jgi:hypothetical protein
MRRRQGAATGMKGTLEMGNNILKGLGAIVVFWIGIKLFGMLIGVLFSLAVLAVPVAVIYALVRPKEPRELSRSNIR